MELETGKDTTGRLMRVGDVWCENRSLLDSTFPERLHLPQGKANGEELSQLPLFWLPAGGNEKRWFRRKNLAKYAGVSSPRALEAALTGMEFNHIAHCEEALFWSRKKVMNKMTWRPIRLSGRLFEIYFIWLRMEIPLLFQGDLMQQVQRWGFNNNNKKT